MNRLLSKIAYADEVQGVDGAVASRQFKLPVEVEEKDTDEEKSLLKLKLSTSSAAKQQGTGATQQFAAEVEFRKKSNESSQKNSSTPRSTNSWWPRRCY